VEEKSNVPAFLETQPFSIGNRNCGEVKVNSYYNIYHTHNPSIDNEFISESAKLQKKEFAASVFTPNTDKNMEKWIEKLENLIKENIEFSKNNREYLSKIEEIMRENQILHEKLLKYEKNSQDLKSTVSQRISLPQTQQIALKIISPKSVTNKKTGSFIGNCERKKFDFAACIFWEGL